MIRRFSLIAIAVMSLAPASAFAVEGPSAAGPIGGTDIRSGMLPPPGWYGGAATVAAGTTKFVDGDGNTPNFLRDAHLTKQIGGVFLLYVPKVDVLGGSVGFSGVLLGINQCGHLFPGQGNRCTTDFGDPYVEADWSRSFVTPRASKYPNAFHILEGLSILLGFGVVLPLGGYDASDPLEQALSSGTNIWDFAPTAAFTYTTPPLLAEGTEFSAKVYWNNYLTNDDTDYRSGDLVNIDFAVTEHIGPIQIGITGFYAKQIEDDARNGGSIAPDGSRGELLQVGGIINYDMPADRASLKVKALKSFEAENTVESWGIVVGYSKGF